MVGLPRKGNVPMQQIPPKYAGRTFATEELKLIREVVEMSAGTSRTELAKTVCELIGWKRPNGSLKGLECREYLQLLESCGFLRLPQKQRRRPVGSSTRIPQTQSGDPGELLEGSIEDFAPLELAEVRGGSEAGLFRELVGRYHPQGYKVAYGAQLRYLLSVSIPQPQVVGCLRFSSPAWRMAARDRWIGWDEPTRLRNLQQVVNNSRFLILPWIRIRNLASHALSLGARRVQQDWLKRYGVEPVLLETLVDPQYVSGTCYLAANWTDVGMTTGRGRMDSEHRREALHPKKVFVYPLVPTAAQLLREG